MSVLVSDGYHHTKERTGHPTSPMCHFIDCLPQGASKILDLINCDRSIKLIIQTLLVTDDIHFSVVIKVTEDPS